MPMPPKAKAPPAAIGKPNAQQCHGKRVAPQYFGSLIKTKGATTHISYGCAFCAYSYT